MGYPQDLLGSFNVIFGCDTSSTLFELLDFYLWRDKRMGRGFEGFILGILDPFKKSFCPVFYNCHCYFVAIVEKSGVEIQLLWFLNFSLLTSIAVRIDYLRLTTTVYIFLNIKEVLLTLRAVDVYNHPTLVLGCSYY